MGQESENVRQIEQEENGGGERVREKATSTEVQLRCADPRSGTKRRSGYPYGFSKASSSVKKSDTVFLQMFGVVLFSVFSVVNSFAEIKKTPKREEYIE